MDRTKPYPIKEFAPSHLGCQRGTRSQKIGRNPPPAAGSHRVGNFMGSLYARQLSEWRFYVVPEYTASASLRSGEAGDDDSLTKSFGGASE